MSDDPTNYVDSPAMPPTQPTLETILERINALGERLGTEINDLRQGQEQLRTDVNTQLKEMDSKLTGLQGQMTELRDGQEKIKNELWALRTAFGRSYGDLMTGQEMHERRINDLEKKVS